MISMTAFRGEDPPPASALVIVDITTRIDLEGTKAIQAFMNANSNGFETDEEAAKAVARHMPNWLRPTDISGLRRNLRERDGRLFWHWIPRWFATTPRRQTMMPQPIGSKRRRDASHSRHCSYAASIAWSSMTKVCSGLSPTSRIARSRWSKEPAIWWREMRTRPSPTPCWHFSRALFRSDE